MNPAVTDGQVRVRHGLTSGDLGEILRLYGQVFGREYGYGLRFEGYVADALARYVQGYDPAWDRTWMVERDGKVLGTITIARAHGPDAETPQAQLRFFVFSPEARGQGVGRRLLNDALAFARERGYRSVFLWTVEELDAALHLYRSVGFVETERKVNREWRTPEYANPAASADGTGVVELRLDLTLE